MRHCAGGRPSYLGVGVQPDGGDLNSGALDDGRGRVSAARRGERFQSIGDTFVQWIFLPLERSCALHPIKSNRTCATDDARPWNDQAPEPL
jgi:hypothetical protein